MPHLAEGFTGRTQLNTYLHSWIAPTPRLTGLLKLCRTGDHDEIGRQHPSRPEGTNPVRDPLPRQASPRDHSKVSLFGKVCKFVAHEGSQPTTPLRHVHSCTSA